MAATDEQRLLVRLEATATKLVNEMKRASAVTAAEVGKIDRTVATSNKRLTDGLTQQGRSFRQATAEANNFRGGIQNTAFQIQDFAVQVAGGTDATRALAQQLPQLLGGLGVFGAVAGAAAAIALPLGAAFLYAGEEAVSLTDRLDALDKAMEALASADRVANTGLGELIEQYGEYADQAQKVLLVQRQLAFVESANALNATADALSNMFGRLERLNEEGQETPEWLKEVEAEFGNLDPNSVVRVEEALGIAREEAIRLTEAMVQLQEANSPEQVAQALKGVVAQLEAATGGAFEMNEEGRELLKSLLQSEDAALRLAAIDLASGFGSAADQAERMRRALANVGKEDPVVFDPRDPRYNATRASMARLQEGAGSTSPFAPQASSGRAGGGGAARSAVDERTRILELGQRELAQLELRSQLVGKNAEQTAFLTAQHQMLTAAKQAGLDLDATSTATGQTLRQEIDAQAASIGRLTAQYQQAAEQQQFFTGLTDDLKSGLVSAIVAGEGFAGVMANIAKQIAEAALQAALFGSGPMAGLFGGAGAGIAGALGFANGGYTGPGGRNDPAGIVHKGEYVFDAATVRKLGLQNLAAIHKGAKGYAGGGYVGGASPNVSVAPAPVSVVVIDSDEKFGEYLSRNPRAEREVMRIVKRNGG